MTGLLQRLIMTVSLQKEDVDEFLQKNVTNNRRYDEYSMTFLNKCSILRKEIYLNRT